MQAEIQKNFHFTVTELARFKKTHLAPGEMQSVVFTGDLLETAGSSDEIEVALEV